MPSPKEKSSKSAQPAQTPPLSTLLLSATKSSSSSEGLPAFLRKKIAFREATHSESLRGLCKVDASTSSYTSYTVNNANNNKKRQLDQETQSSQQSVASKNRDKKYGFTPASTDLFPAARLTAFLKWSKVRPVGPGLNNLGNTCFLNSVLQCLLYTPPLSEFLLAREHSRRCHIPKEEFCGLCALEHLTHRVFSTRESSIRPLEVVGRLKAIGKQFRPGRQEDAHEFLRYLIESLQKSCLPPATTLEHRSRETSFIHRVFGGYLQSTVKCASCQHVSRTFEAFLDLSLDVKQADSLQSALKLFTAPETLSKSNRYRCESCSRLTEAQKKFSVYSAPQVLTVQLKRFFVNPMTGQPGKLNRPISFPERFDLQPCMSDNEHGQSTAYRLSGVIVHEGSTCQSGHYHAFIRAPAGVWYSMNDCSVSRVGIDAVLRQRAYILFYERDGSVETETSTAREEKGVKQEEDATQRSQEKKIKIDNAKSRQERLADAISLGRASQPVEEVPQLVNAAAAQAQPTLPKSTSMWHVYEFQRPAQELVRQGINARAKHLIDNGWQVQVRSEKTEKK